MADYLNYLLYTPPIFLLKEIYTHVVISKIYIPADLPKSYIPAVEIKAISAQPTEVGVGLSWAELGNNVKNGVVVHLVHKNFSTSISHF